MGKNFDTERHERQRTEEERTFTLGGETFVACRSIHPEKLIAYEDLGGDATAGETLKIIDDLVVEMLEPRDNADARYRAVRANTDDPIDLETLQELVKWLIETQTGRPTGRRDGSSPSAAPSGANSTGDSSLPALKAV